MAGDIFETFGIFDMGSDEETQMENKDPIINKEIPEKSLNVTAEPRTERLLGTFVTDPVTGSSVHFCRKIPRSIDHSWSAERSYASERSFMKMIDAAEVISIFNCTLIQIIF